MPGSSSTVTVSSSTSGASGIVASDAWLPGLCSCRTSCCQAIGRGCPLPTIPPLLMPGCWARSSCRATWRRSCSSARVSRSKRASCSFTEAKMLAAECTLQSSMTRVPAAYFGGSQHVLTPILWTLFLARGVGGSAARPPPPRQASPGPPVRGERPLQRPAPKVAPGATTCACEEVRGGTLLLPYWSSQQAG